MLTLVVAGRVYDFSRVVGRNSDLGTGFTYPVGVACGKGDVVYVLNRGYERWPLQPWERTHLGARVSKVTIGNEPEDEEFVLAISKSGIGEDELLWPAGLALDSQENVYVTDEWLNRVSIFDNEGNFLASWGSAGAADGQIDGPSGITINQQGDLYIVDSRNHRVQKFTKEGGFLGQWGTFGSEDGQFDTPCGINIDGQGSIYVADHKNNRVQKFSSDGQYLATFGSYGAGKGQLHRPADVAVDAEGDVYVCDWANDRVQIFGPDGRFVTSLIGDAQEYSKWARLSTNPEKMKRSREARRPEAAWRFSFPAGITFDQTRDRILIADSQRGRLQIYNKLKNYSRPLLTV